MPRTMRRLSETKTYHVMVRGNERKELFLDDDDRIRYMETLSRIAGRSIEESPAFDVKMEKKFEIYAYCLMDNHVHLLINEGEDKIARIMKRIGTSYAYYFNKRYGRVGHLFQDRFKSEPIESEGYLLAAIRYIHNNPVKANIVKYATEYKWSSYHEYVNKPNPQKLINNKIFLDIFSSDKQRAVELFVEYSNQESMEEFIDHVEIRKDKPISTPKDAELFIKDFLLENGIELDKLNLRKNFNIRSELIRQLRNQSNLSIREIASILGVNRGVVQRTNV